MDIFPSLRLYSSLFSSLEYSEIRNIVVQVSQPRRCFLLVGSQQELLGHPTFGEDLRLTYASNHAKKLRNLHTD